MYHPGKMRSLSLVGIRTSWADTPLKPVRVAAEVFCNFPHTATPSTESGDPRQRRALLGSEEITSPNRSLHRPMAVSSSRNTWRHGVADRLVGIGLKSPTTRILVL